jgi:hypothetical protein
VDAACVKQQARNGRAVWPDGGGRQTLMGSLFALDLPAQKIQFRDVIETRLGRIGALAVLRTPHLARRSFRRASLPPKLSRLGCCPRARQYIRMMWYLDRLLPCAISFTLAAGAAHRPAHAAPTDPYRGTPPSHSTASAFAVLAQATQNSELAPEQRARLKAEVARVPSDLRGRFDVRYRAWKYSLNRPDISLSFDPKMRRKPAEFRALIALGLRSFRSSSTS